MSFRGASHHGQQRDHGDVLTPQSPYPSKPLRAYQAASHSRDRCQSGHIHLTVRGQNFTRDDNLRRLVLGEVARERGEEHNVRDSAVRDI